MKASLGKRAFVPLRLLDREMVKRAQTSLLFKERQAQIMDLVLAEGGEDYQPGRVVTVNEYRPRRGGVSFPRDWAVKNLEHIEWTDNTVYPVHGIKFSGSPKPRDAQQAEFFEQLTAHASMPGPQDILANADTGAGKSVAGIYLGQQLGVRTLIIVDQNKLANGWLDNMVKFYGREWTRKYVGRVQQERCEYEGKAFSIGLLQSIVSRDYGHDFRDAFGLVVFDEIQIYGSKAYSEALSLFSARVRLGLTAENRAGSFGRLIKAHIGDTRIVSRQQVMQPVAYLIQNKINSTFYCMTDGAILNGISRLRDRNTKIAKLIKRRGFDRGRHVLVMSERTEQLVTLRNMCIELGVPPDAMGLHMAEYVSGRYDVCYSYGANLQKLATFGSKREADAVVRLLRKGLPSVEMPDALKRRMAKDAQSVTFSVRKEQYKPSQEELDNITNSCQIVFATKQIFSKGVNVPRLDMGVEALPLGNLKQPLGRVLRVLEGKQTPEWYAICDVVEMDGPFKNSGDQAANLLNSFLARKTRSRIAALKRSNAKLVKA